MPDPSRTTITVRLPASLRAALEAHAAAEQRSISNSVQRILQDYFSAKPASQHSA